MDSEYGCYSTIHEFYLKLTKKWLALAFLIGLGLAIAISYAYAATLPSQSETYNPADSPVFLSDGYYYNGVAYAYFIPTPLQVVTPTITTTTPIIANDTITPEILRQYLQSKNSPLADYVLEIESSPYWSTIIGIANAEESLNINPYGSNNFWGLMSHGQIIFFPTISDAITAEADFLTKASNEGKTSVESLNGYYVVPASSSWLNTVLTTKAIVEGL